MGEPKAVVSSCGLEMEEPKAVVLSLWLHSLRPSLSWQCAKLGGINRHRPVKIELGQFKS